jgi:NO-binding membrane sensor protein with MHYT domain/signal transduction histidine kinase/ActR/RegA family two-component response regulator
MIMNGIHNPILVLLSIVIAMFASFTALSLTSRVRAAGGWTRRFWLAAAAIAFGGGIWSMHFIAMLAFSMPSMHINYDLTLTALSLVIALSFTWAGFSVVSREAPSRGRILAAGLLLGMGVAAMHYLGMAAMRMAATISYQILWFAISILIAIGAATVGVWLFARDQAIGPRLLAATMMGTAIAGMHYAGMQAAVFKMDELPHGSAGFSQSYLAVVISTITILILLLALGAAWLERLLKGFERRESQIVLRLQVADALRGGDTEDALRELARMMGEHFHVSRTGYARLDQSKDIFDYHVCWTDGTVPPLLGRYPASAFGVKIVAALASGKTVVVEDLQKSELSNEALTSQTAGELDTRAILVVPFVHGGILRTIVYLNSRLPRNWHREDVAFMEEIAERTRLVIDRAAVEVELRELNATLEARVEARTRDLRETQDALLQSQKMEAIGQLVAGLAHDFNNVLGAIVGAFDLVRRRPDEPDRVKRFAEAGLQAAERGAKLTAQLLAFSRSQRIQLQPLIVCDVIDAIRDLLVRTVGPLTRVDFNLNPDPVPVLADSTQVEMMLLNLAINARDAMPNGGVLTISTAVRQITNDQEIEDGDYVEIAVRDTGTGMSESTLRRAMEPFFTTKPLGKGTGLGLSQIYGSARQAGGTVRIQSALGEGTTVSVLLPCTVRSIADAQALPALSEVSSMPNQLTKVLLVDDDQDLRFMISSALQLQGHQVIEACDGGAALAVLAGSRPDVAIVDFAMPGMNGAELARHLRDLFPELPVVFVSGYADVEAIQSAVDCSATILRKPFRVDELLRVFNQALEHSNADAVVQLAGNQVLATPSQH